jgi:hypothetical protein
MDFADPVHFILASGDRRYGDIVRAALSANPESTAASFLRLQRVGAARLLQQCALTISTAPPPNGTAAAGRNGYPERLAIRAGGRCVAYGCPTASGRPFIIVSSSANSRRLLEGAGRKLQPPCLDTALIKLWDGPLAAPVTLP